MVDFFPFTKGMLPKNEMGNKALIEDAGKSGTGTKGPNKVTSNDMELIKDAGKSGTGASVQSSIDRMAKDMSLYG